MSNAPDLQPKAPAAAVKEAEDAGSEELAEEEEEEEDEEESESDDEDDVQITINVNQPTPIPYGRAASYQRMTIQPGGKANIQ